LQIIVIDDEPSAQKRITALLLQYSFFQSSTITCFETAEDYLNQYEKCSVDVLFLDIDMPGMSGFTLAGELRKHGDRTPIVFITARDDLVTQAFPYMAIGFVRKYCIENDLNFAMKTLKSVLSEQSPTITVKDSTEDKRKSLEIAVSDIYYIESHDHYTYIHTCNKKTYKMRKTLAQYMEDDMFKDFALINSGELVNLKIARLYHDKIILPDETCLSISRRKILDVHRFYQNVNRRVLI
jgi:DNA-binding LytR/AlgR family response regulator